MADTAKLGITKIEASQSQKEVTANAAFDKLDTAIAGQASVSIAGGAGDQALDDADELHSAISLTGTITGNRNVIVSMGKKWHFYNGTSGEYTVTVKRSSGTGVEIPAGEWREVMNDGTNVVEIGGGGGGGGTWGGITGTLSDQTDLQSALDGKADDGDIPTGLTDLDDFPASYTGQGGKLLRVTTGEDGVEFVDPSVQAAIMSQTVGDGSEDTFAIPHGFGSLDVIVIVREATDSGADGYIRIDTGYEVRYYDSDTVQVIFDSPPSAGQYIVTCALPWIQADVPVASPGSATYATPGEYEFVVPPGVDEITGKMWGAGGGGATHSGTGNFTTGGAGGFAQATISVTAGEVLTVHVGAGGEGFTYSANQSRGAGGGGGLTAIMRGSTPLLVAGGGGGGGICPSVLSSDSQIGGAGGGSSGVAGNSIGSVGGGGGGTQSAGGSGGSSLGGVNGQAGSFLTGGEGGYAIDDSYDGYGGSGGYGYYGGGGGGGDSNSASGDSDGAGGGGGSGYVSGTSTTLTAGSGVTPGNSGDGEYPTGVGIGGGGGTAGGPGWVKLSWS